MAKIFISHSSRDKDFARRLTQDLIDLGHEPWLDEWEIKVGECIVSKIEHAISEANYVAIVLSPDSVSSGWVEKEWKTKYWDEINQQETLVLPILIKDCDIPGLLKTKKYADFRNNYSVGLVSLMGGISPVLAQPSSVSGKLKVDSLTSEVSALLSRVQSRSIPLSQCMAEALDVAQKANNPSFISFCKNELTGWNKRKVDENSDEEPNYRLIELFVSPIAQINLQYYGWGQNASAIFDYMRQEKDKFFPIKMLIPDSVSEIESKKTEDPNSGILTVNLKMGQMIPDSETPDAHVFGYGRADTHALILESIRKELTKRLLELLPDVK